MDNIYTLYTRIIYMYIYKYSTNIIAIIKNKLMFIDYNYIDIYRIFIDK